MIESEAGRQAGDDEGREIVRQAGKQAGIESEAGRG